MGFSTMKETDCLVRKALGQFKWTDADAVVSGQTLQTGAKGAVQDACDAANRAKLVKPTAKVGIVGKNLVFRIKHDGGHWGKDDVVLVKGYVRAGPVEGTVAKAQLGSSKVKDMMTVAWWTETRGKYEAGDLGDALAAYEKGVAGIKPTDTSERLQEIEDDLVGTVESAIGGLRSKLGHKDDLATLGRLENAASQARDAFALRRQDAEQRLQKAIREASDGIARRMKEIMAAISRAEETIRGGVVGDAYRDYTLVKQIAVRDTAESCIIPLARGTAETGKVDVARVTEAARRSSAGDDIRKLFAALPQKSKNLLAQIRKLEEGADLDSDHPERTTSQVFGYRNDLIALNGEYKKILKTIDDARKLAITKTQVARKFHQGLANVAKWDARLAVAVVEDVQEIQTLMTETVKVYSGIRSEAGDVKKWVAGAKISSQDTAKFLTPILNRCMATWYEYRDAEAEFLSEVAAIAALMETKFGDAAAKGVEAIRKAVSKEIAHKD